jgi:hypothetical protein
MEMSRDAGSIPAASTGLAARVHGGPFEIIRSMLAGQKLSVPPLTSINVFAMGYSQYQNSQLVIVDFIHHAINSDPDFPEVFVPGQFDNTFRSWIVPQPFQCIGDSAAGRPRNLIHAFFRRRLDYDFVPHWNL